MLKSFLTKYIWTNVTVNSATTVPIEAPIAPNFQIKHIFNIKLLWGLDKLPKYHVLIHALISNETISATTISDIISKNSV